MDVDDNTFSNYKKQQDMHASTANKQREEEDRNRNKKRKLAKFKVEKTIVMHCLADHQEQISSGGLPSLEALKN